MFPVRPNEPSYALLNDPSSQTKNRYGKSIETVPEGHELRNKSLNINQDSGIGENPNRYKQHGFYFNADNCIACHACEAACSEKNDNPAHIAFRSVGFVEGGTYPNYQRINISMACNHCDNPVCLKGCPTRAYTKFAEYGAVLQDPDICFGCGYCTWVCPYNAPQLDPIKGQVSKCNMCVDRLEVGLKPACVSACLGKALDFGVIENIPEGRTQAKTAIPGFPRTDITHPNVRFQQTRVTQRDMVRVDSAPLKYRRDDAKGQYVPEVDEKKGNKKQWSLKKLLSSHENAHIAFTLCAQTVIGGFLIYLASLYLGASNSAVAQISNTSTLIPTLIVMVGLLSFGMFKLNMHLGKPLRFYRGFNNLRHSPVSREIGGVSLFFAGLGGYTFITIINSLYGEIFPGLLLDLTAVAAVIGGAVGSYYMYKLYRIPARPFWDHWQTGTSFVGTSLTGGSLLLVFTMVPMSSVDQIQPFIKLLAMIASIGLALEIIGLIFHARDLKRMSGEGAASFYDQTIQYGKTYLLRNILLGINFVGMIVIASAGFTGNVGIALGLLLAISLLTSAILGRALFYVLVIPTTMPGAFFWRNRSFEEHARKTGLANMPQVGVIPETH